ncbi:MAG TPA: hypothetical protein VFG35_17710 [Actinoplanes sp.]|nr:hypothetical protein [Actinoplanes sp.]
MDRNAARSLILDRLPDRWRVSEPSYSVGGRRWEVVAIGPMVGGRRGPPPETVIGTGDGELAALENDFGRRLGG